ncbi:hypothetical protein A2U01_0089368, partial [Trifolium medium]|nr:hypothetical protein [Trifolium medium]
MKSQQHCVEEQALKISNGGWGNGRGRGRGRTSGGGRGI